MIKPRLTDLNIQEILRYLGYHTGELPDSEMQRVLECADVITNGALPGLVYKQVEVTSGERGVIAGGILLPGNDILRFLSGCRQAIIFAATLGHGVDQLIARMQVEDMARAVILDACASCAVENICDNFETDIRKQVEASGYFLTDRYSPGYGDLPLEVQKELAEMLNCQRRIGLIVADNYLMTPVKSVTAIMGISPVRTSLRNDKCSSCSSYENCKFRNGQC